MALVKDELASATTASGYVNQLQIVQAAGGHTTASFATAALVGGEKVELPAGTPLHYDGTNYKKFVAADVTMDAILWPNAVTLDPTDNATGEIMLKGEVRKFSEIEALVEPADRVALKASCKDTTTAVGIIVRGIANINQ